jgi:hypothetical protein
VGITLLPENKTQKLPQEGKLLLNKLPDIEEKYREMEIIRKEQEIPEILRG